MLIGVTINYGQRELPGSDQQILKEEIQEVTDAMNRIRAEASDAELHEMKMFFLEANEELLLELIERLGNPIIRYNAPLGI